jgi:hypothetical protein
MELEIAKGIWKKLMSLSFVPKFFKKLESDSQVHHFLNIQVKEVGDIVQLCSNLHNRFSLDPFILNKSNLLIGLVVLVNLDVY